MAKKKIPSKLFFKIGEVCEITDTQPYVLRYWESEFPALAPAKNNSGQRIYRRRDIETILRIKTLLYEEGFTIAGAKKKLEAESKAESESGSTSSGDSASPSKSKSKPKSKSKKDKSEAALESDEVTPSSEDATRVREEIREIKAELNGILDLLKQHDAKLEEL